MGGFGVEEIAAAFLARPATVAQRLVRAKRQIRAERLRLEIPPADALPARLQGVLDVLYLLFNEGYAAHGGDNLVRADLCSEAIRLARIVAAYPPTDRPPVHALLALMLLQASRLPARADEAGDLRLLAEQDRARWDDALTTEGLRHLERAAAGETGRGTRGKASRLPRRRADEASTDWLYVLWLSATLELAPSVAR